MILKHIYRTHRWVSWFYDMSTFVGLFDAEVSLSSTRNYMVLSNYSNLQLPKDGTFICTIILGQFRVRTGTPIFKG